MHENGFYPTKGNVVESVAWRVRAGFSLALVVGLSLVGSFMLGRVETLRPYLLISVVAMAVMGLAIFALGFRKLVEADQSPAPANDPQDSVESSHPLMFLRRIGYWGWILIVSALPVFFLTKYFYAAEEPIVPRRTVLTVDVIKVEPVVFPPLRLSGIIYDGQKSKAVIDGVNLAIGDFYKDVRIAVIEADHVIVELNGDQKRLDISKELVSPSKSTKQKSLAVEAKKAGPVEFPSMRLSGIACSRQDSLAVIDNVNMAIGSYHKGVKIARIEPDYVILELEGEQKRLEISNETAGMVIEFKGKAQQKTVASK